MKTFDVNINATIKIDQKVLDAVDDDWRSHYYQLFDEEEIAAHIAFNVFVNNLSLTQIDGFAHLSDDLVEVPRGDISTDCDLVKG